jgi:hypothetical protein
MSLRNEKVLAAGLYLQEIQRQQDERFIDQERVKSLRKSMMQLRKRTSRLNHRLHRATFALHTGDFDLAQVKLSSSSLYTLHVV